MCKRTFINKFSKAGFELVSTEPHIGNIMDEKLWNNKFILINKNPIKQLSKEYAPWYRQGILKIRDIVDRNGTILTKDELQAKYNFTINIMDHNSLIHAIPKTWKRLIKDSLLNDENGTILHITGDKIKDMDSKSIYGI